MKTLRFGLIGLGYFGKNYARLLQQIPGVDLVSISSRSKEAFEKYSSVLPQSTSTTTNYSDILKDPSIDCVVIATPASTHLDIATSAINAGKHVLLEKPMALNLNEADKLREIVEKGKSTFMLGHQLVYQDHLNWLKNHIAAGKLGEIRYVEADFLKFNPQLYAGSFLDAGTHVLSVMQNLFSPKNIEYAVRNSIARYDGLDSLTNAVIKFKNGPAANITTSWHHPEKTRRFAFHGTKGRAVFDDTKDIDKLSLFDGMQTDTYAIPPVTAKEPLRNELEHFIECVNAGKEPRTGIHSSFQIMEWLDAIYKA